MKNYTPLDGLRWSRNSDSALNNVPQTDVLGRAGGDVCASDAALMSRAAIVVMIFICFSFLCKDSQFD